MRSVFPIGRRPATAGTLDAESHELIATQDAATVGMNESFFWIVRVRKAWMTLDAKGYPVSCIVLRSSACEYDVVPM